uniref:Molybdenum cofactor synthesis 3 n=1 Tax=Sinocyclocheilus grahami TaxID=75366 RepID=A0A672PGQ0_SINGR
ITGSKKKILGSTTGNSILTELQENVTNLSPLKSNTTLNNDDIMRYSRQLLLPELGVKGQVAISNLSVLVVGCGGLGCPVAQYLAAAGVGCLGLLDYDVVELSNLHRQVLHTELTQGQPKALSAAQAISRLNSMVQCVPYHLQLSRENAIQLIQQYPLSLIATDQLILNFSWSCTVQNRFICHLDFVSSCMTIYLHTNKHILPGIMGCLQALEVLKIASGQRSSFEKQLLMFDGQEGRFHSIRLRPKQAECVVCGETPTVTELQDYEQFCGSAATDKCRRLILLTKEQRVSVQEYKAVLDIEVDICHLPTSINIPLSSLENKKAEHITLLKDTISDHKQQMDSKSQVPVFVVCKLGNDSQKAVQLLEKMSGQEVEQIAVKDVIGG